MDGDTPTLVQVAYTRRTSIGVLALLVVLALALGASVVTHWRAISASRAARAAVEDCRVASASAAVNCELAAESCASVATSAPPAIEPCAKCPPQTKCRPCSPIPLKVSAPAMRLGDF